VSLSFRIAALAALAAAGVPTGAVAHVTLQPDEAPAGEFKRLDVRVPNERDDASTTKVQVKFPPGFIFVSYQPVAGWQTKLKMAKLDEPVEVFGEKHSEQVDTVTFTAQRTGVAPGQFQDFGLSVALPKRPGATLTFKALQTYSNGEVVRWIGPPGADQPAPQVKLTAAPQQARAAQTTSTASGGGDDDGGDTLAVVALIVGAAGLLAGSMALATARRGSSAPTG
jgi:uncharacterized protein YcnI